MNAFYLPILIVFISFTSYAQDLAPAETYRLHYQKFKQGTQTKAIKLGTNLFSKALNNAGTGHIVLKAESGKWDLLVIVPMDPEKPHRNLNQDKFSKEMLEIAGTEESLTKMMDEFNSYIQDEEMYYYSGVTDYALDNSQYYRSRHIKCTSGNISEALEGGMIHLNGALEKLGAHNLVLRAISGPDDIVVIEPVAKENIFSNSPEYSKKWSAALKTTGTAEEISAFFKRWNEILQREDLHYFTKLSD